MVYITPADDDEEGGGTAGGAMPSDGGTPASATTEVTNTQSLSLPKHEERQQWDEILTTCHHEKNVSTLVEHTRSIVISGASGAIIGTAYPHKAEETYKDVWWVPNGLAGFSAGFINALLAKAYIDPVYKIYIHVTRFPEFCSERKPIKWHVVINIGRAGLFYIGYRSAYPLAFLVGPIYSFPWLVQALLNGAFHAAAFERAKKRFPWLSKKITRWLEHWLGGKSWGELDLQETIGTYDALIMQIIERAERELLTLPLEEVLVHLDEKTNPERFDFLLERIKDKELTTATRDCYPLSTTLVIMQGIALTSFVLETYQGLHEAIIWRIIETILSAGLLLLLVFDVAWEKGATSAQAVGDIRHGRFITPAWKLCRPSVYVSTPLILIFAALSAGTMIEVGKEQVEEPYIDKIPIHLVLVIVVIVYRGIQYIATIYFNASPMGGQQDDAALLSARLLAKTPLRDRFNAKAIYAETQHWFSSLEEVCHDAKPGALTGAVLSALPAVAADSPVAASQPTEPTSTSVAQQSSILIVNILARGSGDSGEALESALLPAAAVNIEHVSESGLAKVTTMTSQLQSFRALRDKRLQEPTFFESVRAKARACWSCCRGS